MFIYIYRSITIYLGFFLDERMRYPFNDSGNVIYTFLVSNY